MSLLDSANTLVLLIDMQPKIIKATKDKTIISYAQKLVKAANLLSIPIIVTEQYPTGLGDTDPSLEELFPEDTKIVPKTAFSAMKEVGFSELLRAYERKQIIICGVEAHICVYQTAMDLVSRGYDVHFLKEASASRSEYEFVSAIEQMRQANISISTLETILFELLEDSKNPHFKEIQSFVK